MSGVVEDMDRRSYRPMDAGGLADIGMTEGEKRELLGKEPSLLAHT